MATTLEGIRGGGGSVRVGTIGTISSLMTRELESSKSSPGYRETIPVKTRKSMDEASSSSSKHKNPDFSRKTRGQKSHNVPVLGVTTLKRPKQTTPLEDVGNSSVRQAMSKKSPDASSKTRSHRSNSQIPMLGSENIHLDKTPLRDLSMKKGVNIVEMVDVGCGNPSLSNRLKKLGFSKLSQSFM
ncbi:hypothetical protein KSS87_001304 [Heliosperma pusillum]|nr:hypothetical protein KSS87_001304 [Heliosperma pusillum]KAH9621448.1 hypothetical protein KSS87_001304 [Heliosperma pusillum]